MTHPIRMKTAHSKCLIDRQFTTPCAAPESSFPIAYTSSRGDEKRMIPSPFDRPTSGASAEAARLLVPLLAKSIHLSVAKSDIIWAADRCILLAKKAVG